MFEKRRKEIAARKAEIRALLEKGGELDIEALEKELRELNAEDAALEKRQALERALNAGEATPAPVPGFPATEHRQDPEAEKRLYRSAWLKTLQGKRLTEAEQRAYSTSADSGLAAIPENTANEIIRRMYETSPILQRCRIFHIPGNLKFPVEGETDEAELHTENTAVKVSEDNTTSVNLTGYEITKLIKASRACSSMAIAAFETFLSTIAADSTARRIEKYIFRGSGVNQPGGVLTAGKGTGGAYTDGVDQVTAGTALTEQNIIDLYGMLGNGYERNAVWAMPKSTFFSKFYPLMNKSKNNLIEFAGGKYYVMGVEVYFTGSVPASEAYLGDFSYIVGNYSQDINIVKSEHSGLATNSIDFLGSCVFDSKAAAGLGAFVHLAKATA